jgi:hypothetical protein
MTTRQAVQHFIVTMSIVVSCATSTAAQASDDDHRGVAESFDQLQVLVRSGTTVDVTNAAGYRVSGRIDRLSPAILSVTANGIRRDYAEADVDFIRQRRGDSLANGARWGAGIGVGIDELIQRPQVVYRRPGLAVSFRF